MAQDLSMQRRLAAEILGVGESRIWIDPSRIDDVASAITREEVRRLIKEGVIKVKPKHSPSRGRWRERHEARKKGRHRGYGRRKGEASARRDPKEEWMHRIRKMRRYLRYLRDHGVIDRRTYRKLYMWAKGGMFPTFASLKRWLEEHGYPTSVRK
ncbi:50S ribosomal protein L19E [Pyrodictium delaneyi]|uniref:Large ribosomal subunit protein eL19 n=1 Tax=Pyrodictium delaneyi TaxID=1273541 RepID=A0A0P0N3S3_9CREN|nr:50S ribosomal protein L19e [Pyrodictium delaneyi]ALL01053.1 50S ribosomal protein L19E [Pyrodictium delaneyi]OWJ55357.1 50S ribosomal protein L19e [Pyrodictium delaneyi]